MFMGENPRVSVITTVYNSEEYLPRCLDSIVAQTYNNLEVIVVDNASEGNVSEIFQSYKELYSQFNWIIVSHKINQGLFKGRISGVEVSTGDYIAFIDSDDRVSCDYYRLLVKKAVETKADMIAARTIFELESGEKKRRNLAALEMFSDEVESADLLGLLYANEGKCYSFHLVWNKLYSRNLWEKAYPHLKAIDQHIVMCEDYVFSTIFFALANALYIEHHATYFYFKGKNAYTSIHARKEQVEKSITDLGTAFSATENFLKAINRYESLCAMHSAFKARYYRFWIGHIQMSDLKRSDKRRLIKLLNHTLSVESSASYSEDEGDSFADSLTTALVDYLELCKNDICNESIKCVSFDIFDTLILRPLLEPQDLFEFLDIECKKQGIQFAYPISKMRINAEKDARDAARRGSNYQEVTLSEIYLKIEQLYQIPHHTAEIVKEIEVALEIKFCRARKIGKELFELAQYLSKQIVLVSDMYLPKSVIQKMLVKCGYPQDTTIYLSSEKRMTKHTGDLFRCMLGERKIDPKTVLHIGDNVFSDIEMAKRCNIQTVHLPKPVDLLQGYNPVLYGGRFYQDAFYSGKNQVHHDCSLKFLAIRCMLALVANKMFDNPFEEYAPQSYFDAKPYLIGYSTWGMHLLGLTYWLAENTKEYESVHFIARDGYSIKKTYDLMFPNRTSNYLYVSRKAMLPLMIEQKKDFFGLNSVVTATAVSPREILKMLSRILPESFDVEQFFERNRFLSDVNFKSETEFNAFLCVLQEEGFDKARIEKYRSYMSAYFDGVIGNHDATFDVGYSGRTESLLHQLTGKVTDAFYVHINNELPFLNKIRHGFKVNYYYNGTPLVTGALRELLMSEMAPSCIGYDVSGSGKVSPVFEKVCNKYPQETILRMFNEGAFDFVDDYLSTFDKWYTEDMPFRYQDASIPIESFLNQAPIFDRWLFKIFDFEDDLFSGGKITIYDFWNMQTASDHGAMAASAETVQFGGLAIWKKFLIYALTDRKKLKEKVKGKYSNSPLLLKLLKIGYSIPRSVYHLFKGK